MQNYVNNPFPQTRDYVLRSCCPGMSAVAEGPMSHCSYPNSYEERFIVPLEKRLRRIGLTFFMSFKKRLALRFKSLRSIWSKGAKRNFRETHVMTAIKQMAGDLSLRSVVSIGTPGPLSKNAVLLLREDGTPVAVAKIGVTPKAKQQVRKEAHWLRLLADEPTITRWTPALIAEGEVDGACVLIQSICSGRIAGSRLSLEHLKFLRLFQTLFADRDTFQNSVMQQEITRRFQSLESRLSPEWSSRARLAIQNLETGLKDVSVMTVAAHRDFAPWNMRVQNGRLCLFDWEYASKGYLPLYDLFHFHLLPIATRSAISQKRLNLIIKVVKECGKALDDAPQKLQAIEVQLLAYLIDVALFYLETNDGRHTGDRVVHCFGGLIDTFSIWGAK